MCQADQWYHAEGAPSLAWWWAVEHKGHPAFYLRTLMPGDFAPGRLPLERHTRTLAGEATGAELLCGTCNEAPLSEELQPIERLTGARAHLEPYRQRRARWPRATDPASCWECSSPGKPTTVVQGRPLCAGCAAHVSRRR